MGQLVEEGDVEEEEDVGFLAEDFVEALHPIEAVFVEEDTVVGFEVAEGTVEDTILITSVIDPSACFS